MDLLSLQLKAAEADRLRVKCVEQGVLLQRAQLLMRGMDVKYRALKGNERRLLLRDKYNRENAEEIEAKWWFRFLPSSVKCLVWHVLDD